MQYRNNEICSTESNEATEQDEVTKKEIVEVTNMLKRGKAADRKR